MNKVKKLWSILQRFLYKSEGISVGTWLNLNDATIKPVVIYACKSWGDPKDQNNLSKIDKFSHSVSKY